MASSYFQYQISGAEQLAEALGLIKDLPTEKRLVRAAITKSLGPMKDEMQRLIPVDKGDLAKSVVITSRLVKSQKDEISNDAVGVYVGTSDHAAHLVEFGTRAHKVTTNKKKTLFGFGKPLGTEIDVPAIAAHPFARPAFEKKKAIVFNRLADEMWKKLEALAKKLHRQAGKGKLNASGKRALGL